MSVSAKTKYLGSTQQTLAATEKRLQRKKLTSEEARALLPLLPLHGLHPVFLHQLCVSVLVISNVGGPATWRELLQGGLDCFHLESHAGGIPDDGVTW